MARQIPLTRGKVAIVDDEDYGWLMQWKWRLHRDQRGACYAVRGAWLNGKKQLIKMHREILNAPADKQVDHIDRDGLHNTRANLRLCNASQNMANRAKFRYGASRFKGVWWCHATGNWRAHVWHYKTIHLGSYKSEEDAARAYDAKARELFGEFARLNFPDAQDGQ